MNCKQGDLARIIKSSLIVLGDSKDALVHVLHLGCLDNSGSCVLPDGVSAQCHPDSWVVELCSPMLFKMNNGTIKERKFATCRDKYLRPINNPGDDVTDAHDILIPEHMREVV